MSTVFRKSRSHNRWTELRDKSRMSVQEIADTIGICNKNQLANIFRGKRKADMEELKMLCMFFKIPLEEGMSINEEVYAMYDPSPDAHTESRHVNAKFITPLSQMRLEKNLTLREVAHYCGIEESAMSKILNGRQACKPAIKEKLMQIFDLGYAQISDLCNRTYNCHPHGDLRKRSNIYLNSEVTDMTEENKENDISYNDPYAPTPEDFKEYEDPDGDMPEPDYSKPISAPENAAYRKWAKKKGVVTEESDNTKTNKWKIEYNNGETCQNEPLTKTDVAKDYCESAERSKKARKEDILDRMLDIAYGKVDRGEYIRLEHVLRYYWLG